MWRSNKEQSGYWAAAASAKRPNTESEDQAEAGWRVGGGIIFNEITIIWLYELVNVIH